LTAIKPQDAGLIPYDNEDRIIKWSLKSLENNQPYRETQPSTINGVTTTYWSEIDSKVVLIKSEQNGNYSISVEVKESSYSNQIQKITKMFFADLSRTYKIKNSN
jgi:hypothetical protein